MQELDNYKQHPSSRLLDDPLRIPVEQLVSRHHEQPWRVKTFSDMNDFASHPSAILSDGTTAVFAKLSEALHGLDQFEVELAGLRYLTERAGVLTPTAIGIVAVPDGVILVLEAVQPVERTEREWRDIGRALARIHQTKWDRCGFERQGYFGPLYQDNRPMRDWLTFYAERRLWPNLMGAINSGHLPTATIQQVEKLIARLPHMGIPEVAPALLHGDAQQNNFVSTPAGAVVIDPADTLNTTWRWWIIFNPCLRRSLMAIAKSRRSIRASASDATCGACRHTSGWLRWQAPSICTYSLRR